MAARPNLFLPSSPLSDHPDSIAERVRRNAIDKVLRKGTTADSGNDSGPDWLDLTLNSTEEEVEAAHANLMKDAPQFRRPPQKVDPEARLEHTCPLGPEWVNWDMFGPLEGDFRIVTADARARCERARTSEPVRHVGRLKLRWITVRAANDEFRRTHAEAVVAGRVLHIDRVMRTRFGPGRSIEEFRIFVDAILEGRGGCAGCSLGFGGRDLPAVALLADALAISVDTIHGVTVPVVELWEVRSPDRPIK